MSDLEAKLRPGLELFNGGRYFEAHESWEDAWRELQGDDKTFAQGLTQVAAAMHKLKTAPDAWEGALYLMDRALAKIEPRFKERPGRLAPLIEIRTRVVAEDLDLSTLPKLEL
jgi:predicted metal-dependent hydrolase